MEPAKLERFRKRLLQMRARLVVAVNDIEEALLEDVVTPGDELLGLVRGLLQAGAQSLVLSLWDVHDNATKDFMVEFYTELGKGHRKADAMRTASIRLRESRPHPYYWAPFLLIGKG